MFTIPCKSIKKKPITSFLKSGFSCSFRRHWTPWKERFAPEPVLRTRRPQWETGYCAQALTAAIANSPGRSQTMPLIFLFPSLGVYTRAHLQCQWRLGKTAAQTSVWRPGVARNGDSPSDWCREGHHHHPGTSVLTSPSSSSRSNQADQTQEGLHSRSSEFKCCAELSPALRTLALTHSPTGGSLEALAEEKEIYHYPEGCGLPFYYFSGLLWRVRVVEVFIFTVYGAGS